MALTFHDLQNASRSRAERWHGGDSWTLLEWAGAMCGEAGEAANFAKKIRRLEGRMKSLTRAIVRPRQEDRSERDRAIHLVADKTDELKVRLAREVADAILYGICILNELEDDAEEVIRTVFNEKSDEYGFPERI